MPTEFVVLICAGIVALVACYCIFSYRFKQKLLRRIRRQFGNPPLEVNGHVTGKMYWESLLEAEKPETYTDDITWNDLDMHNVYLALNACFSAVGDVVLYAALRRPLADPAAQMQNRERLMAALEDAAVREQVQYALARLGRYNAGGIERAAFHAADMVEKRPWLYWVLGLVPLLGVPLLFISLQVGLLWIVISGLLNFMQASMARQKREHSVTALAYLVSQINITKEVAGLLEKAAPEHAAALRAAVKPFGAVTVPFALVYVDNLFAAQGLPNPLTFFQIPLIAFSAIGKKLAGMEPEIRTLYETLGEVDVAGAILSYRESLPLWAKPEFSAENGIRAKRLFHPLLAEPVANNADMAGETLFTGSNASGKSTFIKAIAINNILAQTVNTCTAAAYRLRPGHVATSMAVADSIVEGDSYFIAEIKSLRRLVEFAASGRHATLFIDEILKGTNTVERVAAAAAVLRYLHGTNCQCFAATHDLELTELLRGQFDNYHFREKIEAGQVVFDYVLQAGPATTRNAILLLETMGFPERVTQTARAAVAGFEAEGVWSLPAG